MRAPGSTSYYLLDALGSVLGVVDSAGDVVKRYEYEPYGQAIPTTGSHANPWRFASGYLDGSGFTKFGTRYYVPSLARWTQHDPKRGSLFEPKTLNLYAYVGCDPVNYTDPTGADYFDEIAAGFGTVSVICGAIALGDVEPITKTAAGACSLAAGVAASVAIVLDIFFGDDDDTFFGF